MRLQTLQSIPHATPKISTHIYTYLRVFPNSLLSKGFRDTPNDAVFPVGETTRSRFLPPGFDVVRIGQTLRHPLSFAIVSRCNMHPRQQSDSRQAAHPSEGSRFSAEPRGAAKRCTDSG